MVVFEQKPHASAQNRRDVTLLEIAPGGEPLLTLPNPSQDRAQRRGPNASLFSGRLPGLTQSADLPNRVRVLRD